MNREELYDFVTGLLDDFEMDISLFYSFLDVSQTNRESARPWVILRTQDSTQTASPGDTYLTQKSLPTDFKKWYTRFSVVLTDTNGNVVRQLRQVPIHMKSQYKDDGTKFYVNYATRKLYICGTQTQDCTINQYYISKPTKISAASGNTWIFSSYDDYEKMLAYDIAAMHKLGVDYDQINAAQANSNALSAELIMKNMADWDNELALNAQQGVDYGSAPNGGFTDTTGNVNNLI